MASRSVISGCINDINTPSPLLIHFSELIGMNRMGIGPTGSNFPAFSTTKFTAQQFFELVLAVENPSQCRIKEKFRGSPYTCQKMK
jgi:hypothetical protein